jgi:hypothetical protein
MTCVECRFWSSYNMEDDAGECRRLPPTPPAEQSEGDYAWARFPVTMPAQWCGEFKQKESADGRA